MRHAPQLRRFPFGYNFPLRRAGALALRHSHAPPNSPAARPVVGRPPQLAAGLVKERRARVAPLFGRLAAFKSVRLPPRGELAASFGALGTLSVLASSKAFGRLFAWGAPRGWPGAPFAVGAAASLAAFAFASLASNAADKRAKAD